MIRLGSQTFGLTSSHSSTRDSLTRTGPLSESDRDLLADGDQVPLFGEPESHAEAFAVLSLFLFEFEAEAGQPLERLFAGDFRIDGGDRSPRVVGEQRIDRPSLRLAGRRRARQEIGQAKR